MDKRIKYSVAISAAVGFMTAAYYYPAEIFMTFVVGWLFVIPAMFGTYMVYGLWKYMKERKNRISVIVKPTSAMESIARREEALRREKEMLYSEIRRR